jgi:hypothetical protein
MSDADPFGGWRMRLLRKMAAGATLAATVMTAGAVENWSAIKNTGDPPAWDAGAAPPPSGATQYETKLDRARYSRIRAAAEQMLCVPVGPETGHCLAMDAYTGRLVEFLSRGV